VNISKQMSVSKISRKCQKNISFLVIAAFELCTRYCALVGSYQQLGWSCGNFNHFITYCFSVLPVYKQITVGELHFVCAPVMSWKIRDRAK
jgi:hypothetical protein